MAKDQGVIQTDLRRRTPLRGSPPGGGPPTRAQATPDVVVKKPFDPVKFFAEVRAEARKITWTTWKETWITSVMVGIMVVLAATFFSLVDGALTLAMAFLLKLANAG